MAIRASTARSVAFYMKMGLPLEEAGRQAMEDLDDLGGRYLGRMSFIAMDHEGCHAGFSNVEDNTYIYQTDGNTHLRPGKATLGRKGRNVMTSIIGIPCAFQEPQDGLVRGSSRMYQSIPRALEMAGGAPALIPITAQESTLRALYGRLDGLMLAGGEDIAPSCFGEEAHPQLGQVDAQRDWVELTMTPWALADGMPVFGICRGVQTLNVAAGGSLVQDIEAQAPDALQHRYYPDFPLDLLSHTVRLEPGSRLAEILGREEFEVNSLHHQAVKGVGADLRVTARAPDGMIEALEGSGGAWVVGVQWHPEWLLEKSPSMKRLFEAFVAACEMYQK